MVYGQQTSTDDTKIGIHFRTDGVSKVKAYFAGQNVIVYRPRFPPFAGTQIIPPTNGGEAIMHDYALISGQRVMRLKKHLQGFAGAEHRYFHDRPPSGRTPADEVLGFEIVPAFKEVERPVRTRAQCGSSLSITAAVYRRAGRFGLAKEIQSTG